VEPGAYVFHQAGNQSWHGYIDWCGFPDRTLGETSHTDLYFKAVLAVRKAIKDNKIQWGAALAESHQTIEMIGSTAKTLARAAEAVKHGNFKAAFKSLRLADTKALRRRMKRPRKNRSTRLLKGAKQLAANRWLELQFGWKPMLSDISSGAEFLAERATRNPSTTRFRASGYGIHKYPGVQKLTTDAGNPSYIETSQLMDGVYGYRITVWYEVVNRVAVEAARSGLLDIASTVWEVIPFSFIADWVAPIGTLLDSMTATAGKEFISGTQTFFRKGSAKRQMYVVRYSPGAYLQYDGVATDIVFADMTRDVISDFPAVGVSDLVNIKNPFSVTHVLDALALLGQSMRSFFH
jgi:hypothetical protein